MNFFHSINAFSYLTPKNLVIEVAPVIRQSNPQDNRWRSSLRRHDPELQPTLPSINSNSSSVNSVAYSTEGKKMRSSAMKSAFRKSRSVERMRAMRKLSTSKIPKEPKKSSSEEGNSDDQENSIEENSNTNSSNSPKLRNSPMKKLSGKQKHFNTIGYELGLVDTIEKDILQKFTKIQWTSIAGLSEAKAILQEAVVLPIIMPDFFKGIRRPWKGILLVGPPGGKFKFDSFSFREQNFQINSLHRWQDNVGESRRDGMQYDFFQRVFVDTHVKVPRRFRKARSFAF